MTLAGRVGAVVALVAFGTAGPLVPPATAGALPDGAPARWRTSAVAATAVPPATTGTGDTTGHTGSRPRGHVPRGHGDPEGVPWLCRLVPSSCPWQHS